MHQPLQFQTICPKLIAIAIFFSEKIIAWARKEIDDLATDSWLMGEVDGKQETE